MKLIVFLDLLRKMIKKKKKNQSLITNYFKKESASK